MKEARPAQAKPTIKPLTEEEVERGLAILKQSQALGQSILARRKGQPLSPSWQQIRQARLERSDTL